MRPSILSTRARLACATVLLLVIGVFAWYVWPTPYRYFDWQQMTLREQRFTGRIEYLDPGGWHDPNEVSSAPKQADPFAAVPYANDRDPFADLPDRKKDNPFADLIPDRR